jgi:hypothetical protein
VDEAREEPGGSGALPFNHGERGDALSGAEGGGPAGGARVRRLLDSAPAVSGVGGGG